MRSISGQSTATTSSSCASIVNVLSLLLHRPLDATEEQMIEHLTAGGMAKLNADLSKGISLEDTMIELRQAFLGHQQRRANVMKSLNLASKLLMHELHQQLTPLPQQRSMALNEQNLVDGSLADPLMMLEDVAASFTTDELIFIVGHCREGRFLPPFSRTGSLSRELDLEDLATSHRLEQLESDFELISTTGADAGIRHRLSHLTPTAGSQNLLPNHGFLPQSSVMNLSATCCRPTNELTRTWPPLQVNLVSESPIVSWFHDVPEDPLQVPVTDVKAILKSTVQPPPAAIRIAHESSTRPVSKSVRFALAPEDQEEEEEGRLGYRLSSFVNNRPHPTTNSTSTDSGNRGSRSSSISSSSSSFSLASSIGPSLPSPTTASPLSSSRGSSSSVSASPRSPSSVQRVPTSPHQRKLTSKVAHKLSANFAEFCAMLPL